MMLKFIKNIRTLMLGFVLLFSTSTFAFGNSDLIPEDYPYDAPYSHAQGQDRIFTSIGIGAGTSAVTNIIKQIGNGSWSWNSFFGDVAKGAAGGVLNKVGSFFSWW